MQGERRENVRLNERGVEGDRRYGVLDLMAGTIVSAKKDGRLLAARAMLAGVELTIRLPTGETALGLGSGVDAAITGWLGRPVELVEARPEGRGTYEMPADFEDDESEPLRWDGPPGSFVDSSPLLLLTTASLRALSMERPALTWDVARFRPNLLIESAGNECVEQTWVGRRISAGDVEIEITRPCDRCVVTTRPQPGGITRQLDILRHINSTHERNVGVLARVVRGGRIDVGQPLAFVG